MANKTRIEFDGFEKVIARFSKLNGNVKATTEKALKETHKVITRKADEAITPHSIHYSGMTKRSLKRTAEIKWEADTASVETGFSISKGGLASIFLMYGTKRAFGTPRMKKDQKLWNAFWSKKTKDEIKKIQENIFYDEIRKLGG